MDGKRLTGTVGLLVNPRSGSDVRRVVASAGASTLESKISIVRRLALGAAQVADLRWLTLPEPHQIVRRAVETRKEIVAESLDLQPHFDEGDTTRAAQMLREAGADIVVVLGGDGTNRAAAKGWLTMPVLPLSTGTNNAFPFHVEPTVAGVALGLFVAGVADATVAFGQAKVVHIEGVDDGGHTTNDLALIDAVAVADRFVGSLDLFDPDTMSLAVLTRADPASIGFSSVGGLLEPVGTGDDCGLLIRFVPPETARRTLVAPTAPGHHATIGYEEIRRLDFGERVEVAGPMLLAVDGERKISIAAGQQVTLRVARDGPFVFDVDAVMHRAVEQGYFRRTPETS